MSVTISLERENLQLYWYYFIYCDTLARRAVKRRQLTSLNDISMLLSLFLCFGSRIKLNTVLHVCVSVCVYVCVCVCVCVFKLIV